MTIRKKHRELYRAATLYQGRLTQATFVAQLNAIFVALKLRFPRDFSAVCQCKTSVHVYFVNKSCVPAQK